MIDTALLRGRGILAYALTGIAVSEVTFAIAYGWFRYRYAFGIDSKLGIWFPILSVALVGAMVAVLAWLIRRNPIVD